MGFGALLCACSLIWLALASASLAAPRLHWGRCARGSDAARVGFVCARLRVPLDYHHPFDRQIVLAVVEHRAIAPRRRVGTLFVNPGGPGGTGTVQIPDWFLFLPRAVRERFDVVSWDPRGIGQSTAVQCFPSLEAEAAFLGEAAFFPLDAAQQRTYIARWAALGRRCLARNGELLRHVSTADTARDLDRLRQAVGARQLTYLGLSYGTFLGATYANLFPSRVRALVLDGNLAPSNWTAGGNRSPSLSISLRIGSDLGGGRDLAAFLYYCGRARIADCAFSAGSPRATRAKFASLLARLRLGPIMLGTHVITYAYLLGAIDDGLDIVQPHTDPRLAATAAITGWPGIASPLNMIWKARGTAAASAAPSEPANSGYEGPEQGLSVTCADAFNPRDPRRYIGLVPFVLHRAGAIGLSNLWADEPCATWPVRAVDTYHGPWNRRTANPILVIGNTADPSTPYANAVKMARELRSARLLTVTGYGHTTFLNPSACANRYITAYLINRMLPRRGTVCSQDRRPFAR
jgi:pimeloyl-ACP methyl ester carboxylesterase